MEAVSASSLSLSSSSGAAVESECWIRRVLQVGAASGAPCASRAFVQRATSRARLLPCIHACDQPRSRCAVRKRYPNLWCKLHTDLWCQVCPPELRAHDDLIASRKKPPTYDGNNTNVTGKPLELQSKVPTICGGRLVGCAGVRRITSLQIQPNNVLQWGFERDSKTVLASPRKKRQVTFSPNNYGGPQKPPAS